MIIKTKSLTGSWRFYDSAREVQSAVVGKDKIPVIGSLPEDQQGGVGFAEENVFYENMVTFPLANKTYLMISFFDHDYKARVLYVEDETYLLNDSGKTIERVN